MTVKELIQQLLERPMDEQVIINGTWDYTQTLIIRGSEEMGEPDATYIISK